MSIHFLSINFFNYTSVSPIILFNIIYILFSF